MPVAEFLNRYFCTKQVQVFCFEGGPYFDFAFWSLASLLSIALFYKWREGPSYKKPNRIDGKVVIVTGCNTGIGKEVALEMAKRGARVYMACRDFNKCEKARREIVLLSGNTNVFNRILDLSSLQSVREFAEKFNSEERRLDILVNNAGIMAPPRKLTTDGFEQQFGVNHLGHFLLTNLLLDKLKASAPSRVVVLSSLAHIFGRIQKDDINSEQSYDPFKAYAQSKLANILFTRKLAKMLKDAKVDVNCLHPGSVQSELSRNNILLKVFSAIFSKFILRSTKGGAQTVLYLALDPDMEGITGGYYDRMELAPLTRKARDDEMADWLWKKSEEMVGLKKSD
ncbi:retinol dehydrogenase 12-like [Musca domestica]|uniref:Retinol dehydrogenase 12-like n=1 Tax=Musca domestica TaxID=7370 RepID=A0ABM3UM62_MUSDO|nr:retinol dehydrogenase 12-like [Musca domestica]